MNLSFEELSKLVEQQFQLPKTSIHGPDHWQRVRENGLGLAAETGANKRFVELFAVLHDARRRSDGHDPKHGQHAALLAEAWRPKYFPDLDKSLLGWLTLAIKWHASGCIRRGASRSDILVGTCWDADRLDLVRAGIKPDPRKMSTAAGIRKVRELPPPPPRQWASGYTHSQIRSALESVRRDKQHLLSHLPIPKVFHGTSETAARAIAEKGLVPRGAAPVETQRQWQGFAQTESENRHSRYKNLLWIGGRESLSFALSAAKAISADEQISILQIDFKRLDRNLLRAEASTLALLARNKLAGEPPANQQEYNPLTFEFRRVIIEQGMVFEFADLWPLSYLQGWGHEGPIEPDLITKWITLHPRIFVDSIDKKILENDPDYQSLYIKFLFGLASQSDLERARTRLAWERASKPLQIPRLLI
jgi:uncharacterized protein